MNIGAAFGDHIKTGKARRKYSNPEQANAMRPGIILLSLFIFPAMVLLKLFDIQLVHGGYYRSISDSNRTRTNILYPARGVIFDRSGVPLVINSPGFEKTDGEEKDSIPREQAMELNQKNAKLEISSKRYYPFKSTMSHVLGYVGRISPQEVALPEYAELSTKDLIGKSGIERYYDTLLRGTHGKELVEVDAMGGKIRILGTSDPIPGQDIHLTIESNLQKAADDALPLGKKGVVIVSSPHGEVLAMVSSPSFDPNLFTMGDTYKASSSAYQSIESILADNENQPLMDRAISGVYPPGSTFKLITAAVGLEKKIIDSRYTVEDTGVIKVGEFSFGNWYFLEQGKKDGMVNVVKAISRSNDIFFYKLAEKISVDTLSQMASQFGVGKKMEIDLPSESRGLLPTKSWKTRVIKEPWYLGDTYHYGIGQGYLLTTPLQVNSWTATIANGGFVYKPHLLKSEGTGEGTKILTENTVALIRQGMIDSCKPGGVAWPLFEFRIQNSELRIDGKNYLAVKNATGAAVRNDLREVSIACKTGTAQHGGEETLPHAWITRFAPAYNPQIVVTVLIESAGQGSNEAGPVAKKVLEEWFSE